MWNVFFAYTVAHNPLTPEEMYKRSLVTFCQDCRISKAPPKTRSSLGPKFTPTPAAKRATGPIKGKALMAAEVNVIHQSHASRHPEKKFLFSCFKAAMVQIAQKLYASKAAPGTKPEELLERLLEERVLPNALLRDAQDVDGLLDALDELERRFSPCLKSFFDFFASPPTRYERTVLGRHAPRPDISRMGQSLTFEGWLQFCATFNISAGTGSAISSLSNVDLASAFLDSIKVELSDRVGGLTFEEFWEALVRCAIRMQPPTDGVDVVEEAGDTAPHLAPYRMLVLFRMMMSNIENGVNRCINGGFERQHNRGGEVTTGGGRTVKGNASGLMQGSKAFQKLVMEYALSDYMHGHHHSAPGSGTAKPSKPHRAAHEYPAEMLAEAERADATPAAAAHTGAAAAGAAPRRRPSASALMGGYDGYGSSEAAGSAAGNPYSRDAYYGVAGAAPPRPPPAAASATAAAAPPPHRYDRHRAPVPAVAHTVRPPQRTERSASVQALFRATMREDVGELQRLLDEGADASVTNAAGLTVVGLAKERNKKQALQFLRSRGL